jgi:hypothetical protein
MKATLVSCLAMQLTLGVGAMVAAPSVTGTAEVAAVETIVGHGRGQDQAARMKRDIELAGFFLTVEEWQSFDPAARAQLLSAASPC